MGLTDKIKGKNIYLDTNIFIYAIEQHQDYKDIVNIIFNEIDNNNLMAFTSEMTLQECLIKPFKDKDVVLEKAYNSLLKDRDSFFMQSINKKILIESSKIRAMSKIKTPDAIHLATAIYLGCDILITNDSDFKSDDIEIIYLFDLL